MTAEPQDAPREQPALERVRTLADDVRAQLARVVVGQDAVVEALLVALLCRGHVLIEGVPGTGKTLLARVFARVLGLGFSRVQFTPDLLPGDVVGTNLFDFQSGTFRLTRGPVFTDFLLADEINRTPPKTQSALLEAMQERAVTLDGTSHPLGDDFLVVATQNPIEQEGTYPLPEAQLDRFLFKVTMPLPSRDEERAIVAQHGHRTATPPLESFGLSVVATREQLAAARAVVEQVTLSSALVDYVVDLVRRTREDPAVASGASPRAGAMLASASRALAALRGRTYVVPDDVKELAGHTLRHRLLLSAAAEVEGLTTARVLDRIVAAVPVPR